MIPPGTACMIQPQSRFGAPVGSSDQFETDCNIGSVRSMSLVVALVLSRELNTSVVFPSLQGGTWAHGHT